MGFKKRPPRRKGLAHLAAGDSSMIEGPKGTFRSRERQPLCGADLEAQRQAKAAGEKVTPGFITHALTQVNCPDCLALMPADVDHYVHKAGGPDKTICGKTTMTPAMKAADSHGLDARDEWGIHISCAACKKLQPEIVCKVDYDPFSREELSDGSLFGEPPTVRWKAKTVCGKPAKPGDVSRFWGGVTCRTCMAADPYPTHMTSDPARPHNAAPLCGGKRSSINYHTTPHRDRVGCVACLAVLDAPKVPDFIANSALVVIQNALLVGRKRGKAKPLAELARRSEVAPDLGALSVKLGVPQRWLEDLEKGWSGVKPQLPADLPVYRAAFNAGRRLARKYAS